MVKAKKHLGQHFLINKHIAEKIIQSFLECPRQLTIEIGAGTGVLTEYLLKEFDDTNFFALDVDRESIEYLKQHYPKHTNQFLLEDFLHSENIDKLLMQPCNIIGNFPYNISSQIMFKVLEHKQNVYSVVGMFQKEVAERICSKPGTKAYGILSVLLQTFYETQYLFTVSEDCFDPPPKVKSAVIKLSKKPNIQLPCQEKFYFNVVKTAFNQRRKTLRNSLKKYSYNNENIIYNDKRPEQLGYEQFIELAKQLEELTY